MIVTTVYHPHGQNNDLMNEFGSFHPWTLSPNIILLGDFNVDMDNTSNTLAKDLISCLDSFNFHNILTF